MVTDRTIVLRCYVYQERGHFYGECIDLDIIVKRESLIEALRAIEEAVVGHVEAAFRQGWADELIPRKAPWTDRLRFHWRTTPRRLLRSLKSVVQADHVVSIQGGQLSVA